MKRDSSTWLQPGNPRWTTVLRLREVPLIQALHESRPPIELFDQILTGSRAHQGSPHYQKPRHGTGPVAVTHWRIRRTRTESLNQNSSCNLTDLSGQSDPMEPLGLSIRLRTLLGNEPRLFSPPAQLMGSLPKSSSLPPKTPSPMDGSSGTRPRSSHAPRSQGQTRMAPKAKPGKLQRLAPVDPYSPEGMRSRPPEIQDLRETQSPKGGDRARPKGPTAWGWTERIGRLEERGPEPGYYDPISLAEPEQPGSAGEALSREPGESDLDGLFRQDFPHGIAPDSQGQVVDLELCTYTRETHDGRQGRVQTIPLWLNPPRQAPAPGQRLPGRHDPRDPDKTRPEALQAPVLGLCPVCQTYRDAFVLTDRATQWACEPCVRLNIKPQPREKLIGKLADALVAGQGEVLWDHLTSSRKVDRGVLREAYDLAKARTKAQQSHDLRAQIKRANQHDALKYQVYAASNAERMPPTPQKRELSPPMVPLGSRPQTKTGDPGALPAPLVPLGTRPKKLS